MGPKKSKSQAAEPEEISVTRNDEQLPDWMSAGATEGELSIDVFQDERNIYVKSPVAGVTPETLEITIHNDMLTIRGRRELGREVKRSDYYYQECYWGSFSRSVILPVDVKADEIKAELRHGILTITLPKSSRNRTIPVAIKE